MKKIKTKLFLFVTASIVSMGSVLSLTNNDSIAARAEDVVIELNSDTMGTDANTGIKNITINNIGFESYNTELSYNLASGSDMNIGISPDIGYIRNTNNVSNSYIKQIEVYQYFRPRAMSLSVGTTTSTMQALETVYTSDYITTWNFTESNNFDYFSISPIEYASTLKSLLIRYIKVTFAISLSSLSAAGSPSKTSYYEGEYFDPSGMTFTAQYAGVTQTDVSEFVAFSPSPLTLGTTEVLASYDDGETTKYYLIQGVTVNEYKTLEAITISGTLQKSQYYVGDSFDPLGLVVTAHYDDLSTSDVTSETTFTPEILTTASNYVIASYTEMEMTATAQFSSFTVLEKTLQSIAIKTLPLKVNFSLGEIFTFQGLEIYANYNGGVEELSEGFTVDADTMLIGQSSAFISLEGESTNYQINVSNLNADVGLNKNYYSDLIISEYIEGSDNNQAIELFNGTGQSIDLSNYTLKLYSNGATTPHLNVSFSGLVAHNETYVIANPLASSELLSAADITYSDLCDFDGDDSIALFHGVNIIDLFGDITTATDPGEAWLVEDYSGTTVSTKDRTFVREPTITSPSASSPFLANQWNSYPINTSEHLGNHTFEKSTITYLEQAQAFANYVMFYGENARGTTEDPGLGCHAIFEQLSIEYNYMPSTTIAIFNSDPMFSLAYDRLNYLTLWTQINPEPTSLISTTDDQENKTIINVLFIVLLTMSSLIGFYIVKQKNN